MVVVVKMVMTLKEGKGGLLIDSQEGEGGAKEKGFKRRCGQRTRIDKLHQSRRSEREAGGAYCNKGASIRVTTAGKGHRGRVRERKQPLHASSFRRGGSSCVSASKNHSSSPSARWL